MEIETFKASRAAARTAAVVIENGDVGTALCELAQRSLGAAPDGNEEGRRAARVARVDGRRDGLGDDKLSTEVSVRLTAVPGRRRSTGMHEMNMCTYLDEIAEHVIIAVLAGDVESVAAHAVCGAYHLRDVGGTVLIGQTAEFTNIGCRGPVSRGRAHNRRDCVWRVCFSTKGANGKGRAGRRDARLLFPRKAWCTKR